MARRQARIAAWSSCTIRQPRSAAPQNLLFDLQRNAAENWQRRRRKAEQRAQKREASGSPVLIYLERRVVLLMHQKEHGPVSRVSSASALLPVGFQGKSKRATKQKQTNVPLFVYFVRSFLLIQSPKQGRFTLQKISLKRGGPQFYIMSRQAG